MSAIQQLITEHMDIWTAADTTKRSGRGRASGNAGSVYGVKKLRELILELAVHGKLVPQDANDEPASELLKRIQTGKLNAKLKNKDVKFQTSIADEELKAKLPKGWEWAFIPQAVSNEKYSIKRGPFGSAIKKSYFVSTGYKVYEQQHAINDDFSLGNYYLAEDKFNELKVFSVKPNDIIISCSGTVGKVAIAPDWMEPGVINQALLKLTLNENVLTNSYFKILFPAFYMKTETLSDLKGTAQKNMVSVDELKNEPFPLPPLAEQQRIVAKVDELMALCDRLETQHSNAAEAHEKLVSHLLGTLTQSQSADDFSANWQRIAVHFDTLFTTEASIDALKQTLLQLAVMGKLVPQDANDEPAIELLEHIQAEKAKLVAEGKTKKEKPLPPINEDEKPFDLPRGWEWQRLSDTYYSISPKGRQLKGSEIKELGKYPVVDQGQSFISGYTDLTDLLIEIPHAIIVFGDHTTNIKLIDFNFVAGADGTKLLAPILIYPNFYYYYLQSYKLENRGYARHFKVLNNNLIAIPPIAEQQRIVAKVDELMALCDQLKTRIQQVNQQQQKLADVMVAQVLN